MYPETSSNSFFPSIERLKGRENFDTWQFGIKAYLEHEGLWKFVTLPAGTELKDNEKQLDLKTKSKLIMMIDPVNYVHVKTATTAAEVWTALLSAFEFNQIGRM